MIKRSLISAALVASLVLPFTFSSFAASSVTGGVPSYGTVNTGGSGRSSSGGRVRRSVSSSTAAVSGPGTMAKSLDASISTDIVAGEAAIAGLPKEVVDKINAINSGASLKDVLGRADLEGYMALGKTSAIVSRDASTKAIKDVSSNNVINIPNLVAGLNKPVVLFYNNTTGKWEVLTITNIDSTKRDITVTIPGSGTFVVAYMK